MKPTKCGECKAFSSTPIAAKYGTFNCRAFEIMRKPDQPACNRPKAKARKEEPDQEAML